MQAGKLNKRVTLQKPVKTQSPTTGAIVSGWADVAELWANVTDLSARDFVAAQAGQNEVTTRITIVHRGRIYDITGVLEDDKSGREYLTLPCSRGVNDG
ncbi:phage head closure protein [Atlantibacter subterraneus]|uniref:phage head closure protein n=1 Tax=Atlantibacter subterraneus TaxID=255519 RepID=UPI002FDE6442